MLAGRKFSITQRLTGNLSQRSRLQYNQNRQNTILKLYFQLHALCNKVMLSKPAGRGIPLTFQHQMLSSFLKFGSLPSTSTRYIWDENEVITDWNFKHTQVIKVMEEKWTKKSVTDYAGVEGSGTRSHLLTQVGGTSTVPEVDNPMVMYNMQCCCATTHCIEAGSNVTGSKSPDKYSGVWWWY